ncbi:MAG: class II aldolase/adducin family protein [Bacillota bacterium]|nr:class II aldolase/adducin family protein [Bacillota bacterium]
MMDIMVKKDKMQAKQQVIRAGKELSYSGLIARTWGNVSCRTGEDAFVITASGRNYLTLTEDEVIEVKISDLSYRGDVKPSSEKKVHREVYRLKPEAGFVIHTHQSNASAVSAMGLTEVVFDKVYPSIGNKVLCADYGLPGTKKLCRNTAAAVEASQGKAVIMRHHGAVCYGRDYEEAFQVAHELEKACGAYLKALGVEPWSFSEERPEGDAAAAGSEASGDRSSAVLWNTSPVVLKFAEEEQELRPYLDDFAQLVGTVLKVREYTDDEIKEAPAAGTPLLVKGKGALCGAAEAGDAEAFSMVIEKNCRAFLAAQAGRGGRTGRDAADGNGCGAAKPIKHWECVLMRQIYLKKYSKLSQKSAKA